MARLFDGINDSLTAAINLSSTRFLSVSFWLWWDAYATDNDLAMEFTADGTAVGSGGFTLDPNAGDGTFVFWWHGTSSINVIQSSFVRPSAAAWHHYTFAFDNGNTVGPVYPTATVYVDGSAVTLTPATPAFPEPGNNFANSTLNFMSRNNASLFAAGRMAEVGIWDRLVTATEAGHLGTDKWAPTLVPTNLIHYWMLEGTASPEPENAGAHATVNGAVSTAHPPGIVYPGAPLLLLLSRRQDSRAA